MDATLRTVVYVDGFNFYYGQLKGTPWRWLDLDRLFSEVLGKQHCLVGIEYFTARVQPTAFNPQTHRRQSAWLKAQSLMSNRIRIHYGHFLRHKIRMENADPPQNRHHHAGRTYQKDIMGTGKTGGLCAYDPDIGAAASAIAKHDSRYRAA